MSNNLIIELMQWQAQMVRGVHSTARKIFLDLEKGTLIIDLSDLRFEVLSQDFVRRVEAPQQMAVRRKRVQYIL